MAYPTYGSKGRTFDQMEQAISDAGGPRPEVLGVVNPQSVSETPPPPWEVGGQFDPGDARAFVDVPDDWVLRWKNPKVVDREGWNYWMKVEPQDRRVKVHNSSMVQVDNTIRRGGANGDILTWMHRSWRDSWIKQLRKRTDDLSGSVTEKREALNEQFKRGTFGPYVQGEAKHTTTQVRQDTFSEIAR